MVRGIQCRVTWYHLVGSYFSCGDFETLTLKEDVVITGRWIRVHKLSLNARWEGGLRLRAMNDFIGRLKAEFFHQAIWGLTRLRIEVSEDKDFVGIDFGFLCLHPVDHLFSLVLSQVVSEFDSLAWVVQMQIDHDKVATSNIIFERDHLAIADATHVQDFVGDYLKLRATSRRAEPSPVSSENVAIEACIRIRLGSPYLKKLQLHGS